MVFAKHLKYRRIIEIITLCFSFTRLSNKNKNKQKQIKNQSVSAKAVNVFYQGEEFFSALWTDKLCDEEP